MKRNNLHVGLMAFAMLLVGASCSDDDNTPSYSTGAVQNTELKTILVQRGYTFNEDGNLLLDDLAKNTTTLDLSGTQISTDALAELSMFPNLTDVDLSDNEYSLSFDFSSLPEQITGVDLTGNELYEFPGLVNIETLENGDENVTVLHSLAKLYLPESAKYNCNEIVAFYQNASGVDMQMENRAGTLSAYNTLREVPDEITRVALQELFPSMFEGDNIDISKRLVKADERSKNILISESGVTSVEGVEYILMNRGYQGAQIMITSTEECELPYLKLGDTFTTIALRNVSTPNLDISEAVNLCLIQIVSNESLKVLDLSNCKKLGQRGYEMETAPFNNPSSVTLTDCDNLESFLLPSEATIISQISMCILPSLGNINMSNLEFVGTLVLGDLAKATIEYPNYTRWSELNSATFAITEDIYAKDETKTFLDLFHENLTQGSNGAFPQGFGLKVYRWKSIHY